MDARTVYEHFTIEEQQRLETLRTTADKTVLDVVTSADEVDGMTAIALTHNPHATTTHLRWAMRSNDTVVMKCVARHPEVSRSILLGMLAKCERIWVGFILTPPPTDPVDLHIAKDHMTDVLAVQETIWNRLGPLSAHEAMKSAHSLLKAWFPRTRFDITTSGNTEVYDLIIEWNGGPFPSGVRAVTRLFVRMTERLEGEPCLGPFDRLICFQNE